MPDLLGLEAALVQKAHLARTLACIGRGGVAEALAPHLARRAAPSRGVQVEKLGSQRVAHAAAPQLVADLERSLPTSGPLGDEALGEAPIGEEIARFELVECRGDRRGGKAPRRELASELLARVLAAREQRLRLVKYLARLVAQASASSTCASSAAAGAGRPSSFSRSAVSICLAMSGFCLRNSRTLSLPCPMRSPL